MTEEKNKAPIIDKAEIIEDYNNYIDKCNLWVRHLAQNEELPLRWDWDDEIKLRHQRDADQVIIDAQAEEINTLKAQGKVLDEKADYTCEGCHFGIFEAQDYHDGEYICEYPVKDFDVQGCPLLKGIRKELAKAICQLATEGDKG